MIENFDDKPIGFTNQSMMQQYPPDFNPNAIGSDEPKIIPIEKKIKSNVWKIRKEALEELLQLVRNDPNELQKNHVEIIRLITDSNIHCQEIGLKIILACLQQSYALGIQIKMLIKNLTEKCLITDKEQIVKISYEIIYSELDHYETHEFVLKEINQLILTKNPKVCSTTIKLLTNILHNYGAKKLKYLQKFQKNLELLANSVRPIAKKQCIQLFKQIYRWMGQKVLDFNIHSDVKDQLKKFMKQYKYEPMQIKRGLPKGQKKTKKIYDQIDQQENSTEPLDVLNSYDTRWVDKVLELQKWKEKKSFLDEFIKKTKIPSILPRQHSHYCTLIKRLMTDNNINLLQCGFKITMNLCKGLKKHFRQSCKTIMSYIFVRLKDGKAMISDEAKQTLKSMLCCITMDDMMQQIRQGLNDKAPIMRVQILKFIEYFISKKDQKIMINFKQLLDILIKLNEDGSAEVRDTALTFLCKIKATQGIRFFGDKLKKLAYKKIQIIQNYQSQCENEMMQIQQGADIIRQLSNRLPSQKQKLDKENYLNQQSLEVLSIASQPLPKITHIKPTFNYKDLSSPNQANRINCYHNLLLNNLSNDIIDSMKSKSIRENSVNILKIILQIVNKIVGDKSVELQHIELLMMHDWRKVRNLLHDFIQSHTLTFDALEYVKNCGILNRKDKIYNHGSISPTKNVILKKFISDFHNLLPRMTNPLQIHKLQAAQNAIRLLQSYPGTIPQSQLTIANGWSPDIVNQFYNVTKCRLQQSSPNILSKYVMLITLMLQKGLIPKCKGNRNILPIIIQRINQNIPQIHHLLQQYVQNNPIYLFQFLPVQFSKPSLRQVLVDFIMHNIQIFVKKAEMKNYILPLLECIGSEVQGTRCWKKCTMLLDQIVELNGEAILQKIAKQCRIKEIQSYLSKWNIQVNIKTTSNNNNRNNARNSADGIILSKNQRLKQDQNNVWPPENTSQTIIQLMNIFTNLGQPLSMLATPLRLHDYHIEIINILTVQFLQNYSDLLLKWCYWRLQIENSHITLRILSFSKSIIRAVGSNLSEKESIILLSGLSQCILVHKQCLNDIIEVNQTLISNNSADIEALSFHFWINLCNQNNQQHDNILHLLSHSYGSMITKEMVTLSRIPNIVKNATFNKYLYANYDDRMLTVYGFKNNTQHTEIKSAQSSKKHYEYLCNMTSPENIINVQPALMNFFHEIIQRSSSNQAMQRIIEHTNKISPKQVIEEHLKIMYTIIVPFLQRDLPFINVYNYFKFLQRIIQSSNVECEGNEKVLISPYLSGLLRMLIYFLIDLDEIKMDNKAEMMKVINKIILILLQTMDSKHILQVLFMLFKAQLQQIQPNDKLIHLLCKCIAKVSKNNGFQQHLNNNIQYIFKQINLLIQVNRFEQILTKPLRNMIVQINNNHKTLIQIIIAQYLQNDALNSMMRQLLTQVKQVAHNLANSNTSVNSNKILTGAPNQEAKANEKQLKVLQAITTVGVNSQGQSELNKKVIN